MYFFVPLNSITAVVDGFWPVFEDLDQSTTTTVQLFDSAGAGLGAYVVPLRSGGLSFPGTFTSNGKSAIARVCISTGNALIAASDNSAGPAIVVNDDLIHGERVNMFFVNVLDRCGRARN